MTDESFWNAVDIVLWLAFPEGKGFQAGATPVIRGLAKWGDDGIRICQAMSKEAQAIAKEKALLEDAIKAYKVRQSDRIYAMFEALVEKYQISSADAEVLRRMLYRKGGLADAISWVHGKYGVK